MALLPNWFRASITIPVRIAFFWLRGDTSISNVLLIGSALVQFLLFMSEIILLGADIFAAHTMLSADLPTSLTVDLLKTASSFTLSYYPVRLSKMSSCSAVQLGILECSLCSTPNNCSALHHDAAVSWAIEAQVLGLYPTHSMPFPTQHVVTNGPSAVHNQSRQVSAIATMLHSPLLSQSDMGGFCQGAETCPTGVGRNGRTNSAKSRTHFRSRRIARDIQASGCRSVGEKAPDDRRQNTCLTTTRGFVQSGG